VEKIAEKFSLKVFKPKSLNSGDSAKHLKSLNLDLLVCCHGREILKKEILEIPEKGCINLHPCLYKYKGARPIERLLEDKNPKASIGVHYMIEEVDMGDVITEIFVDVSGCSIPIEVYNKLYIYYSLALIDAIDKIKIKI
jgi:methionyl-tRNA formyltransferase